MHAHGLGILYGHVAKTADARDNHPFAGAHFGFLQALVDGDAGAEHRGRRTEFEIVRQATDKVRVGEAILGKGAIDRIAGVLLAAAQRFPAGAAGRAATAGGVQPRNADTVAFLDAGYAGTELGDIADAFMAGNEGRVRLDRPVAIGGVQVGMADAGRFVLDEDLARSRLRNGHLLDHQRLAEFTDDGSFHHLGHVCLSPLLSLKSERPFPSGRPSLRQQHTRERRDGFDTHQLRNRYAFPGVAGMRHPRPMHHAARQQEIAFSGERAPRRDRPKRSANDAGRWAGTNRAGSPE